MQSFTIETRRRTQLVAITAQVESAVRALGRREGVATVFVPHTTAGVTINENADPDVAADLEQAMERLVPQEAGYARMPRATARRTCAPAWRAPRAASRWSTAVCASARGRGSISASSTVHARARCGCCRRLLEHVAGGHPAAVLSVLMVLAMLLSSLMNNAATAAVMCPIAFGMAEALEVRPDGLLMAVAIGVPLILRHWSL